MSFWQKLIGSVYDPALYREIPQQSFSKGFGFFIKYTLLLSAVTSLILLALLGNFVYRGGMDKMSKGVESLYPEDLVVTIEKGIVSINQEQPYGIPIPGDTAENINDGDIHYLVVIDTEYPITVEAFNEYGTMVIVGQTSIGMRNSRGEVKMVEISKDTNVVIDRAKVDSGANAIMEFVRHTGFVWIGVLLPILVFVGMFVGMMVYLVFASLIIWLIATVKGLRYSYGQSYVIGMHLIALPQALSMLAGWMMVVKIPFLRTIILVALAVVNLKNANQQPTTNDQQQNPTHDSQPTIDDRDSKGVSEPKDAEIEVK